MRPTRCLALTGALFLSSSVANAQPVSWEITPGNWDLHGTWVLRGRGVNQERVCREFIATIDLPIGAGNTNFERYNVDSIEFVRRSQDLKTDPSGLQFIEVVYDGQYRHRAAYFERNPNFPADGRPLNLPCATQDFAYSIQATLLRWIDREEPNGKERPAFDLTITGMLGSGASFETAQSFEGAEWNNLSAGLGGADVSYLFNDVLGRSIRLEALIEDDPLATEGAFPGACTGRKPVSWGGYVCRQIASSSVDYFERGAPGEGLNPTSSMNGTLVSADGMGPIAEASLRLHRLGGPLRPQGANETDRDYEDYVALRLADSPITATTMVEAQGQFRFDKVPVLSRGGGAEVGTRQLYAVAITGARRRTTLPDNTSVRVLYRPKVIENVVVSGRDIGTVQLEPIDEIANKFRFTSLLTQLGPKQYGPIESDVEAYLNGLVGAGNPTDEQLEGVKRAVWAERVVYEGGAYAKGFLKEVILGVADTLAIAIESLISTKRDSAAAQAVEMRLGNLRAAKNFMRLEAKGWNQLVGKTPDFERINKNIDDLVKSNADVQQRAAAKSIKFVIKFVFDRVSSRVDDPATKTILRRLQLAFDGMVDIIFVREIGGVAAAVVKEIVSSYADDFFDNSSAAFSYTGRTKDLLELSRTEMVGWPTASPAAYEADIDRVNAELQALFSRVSNVQTRMEYEKAAAKTLGSAKSVIEVVGITPEGAAAAKAAEGGQVAATLAAFVEALVTTFYYLPRQTELGVYRAYGRVPPLAVQVTAPSVPGDSTAATELETALVELRNAMNAMRGALRADDVVAVLDAIDATVDTSVAFRLDETLLRMSVAAAAASSLDTQAGDVALFLDDLGRDLLDLEIQSQLVRDRSTELVLNVLDETYAGPADPRYLLDRVRLLATLEEIDRIRTRSTGMVQNLAAYLRQERMFPIAMVERVEIQSTTSGTDELASAGESFDVVATVRNLTSTPLSVTATVALNDPTNAFSISGGRQSASLDAAGQANDRIQLTWSLAHVGSDATVDAAGISVRLGESDGSEPSAFFDVSGSAIVAPSLARRDADGDTMPDALERRFGLDPTLDDAAADLDGDGIANARELRLDLDPGETDSDGDGLSDGEELTVGADGHVTDPSSVDTDGDGILDAQDGSPTDVSTASVAPGLDEPSISIAETELSLSASNASTEVLVQNGGSGVLRWTAVSDDPSRVSISPSLPQFASEGTALALTWNREAGDLEAQTVKVRVIDVSGFEHDVVVLNVNVAGASGTLDGGVGGDAGGPNGSDGGGVGPGSDGGMPGPGSDAGGAGEDTEGCGCMSAQGAPDNSGHLAAWLLVLCMLRRGGRLRHKPRRPSERRSRISSSRIPTTIRFVPGCPDGGASMPVEAGRSPPSSQSAHARGDPASSPTRRGGQCR